MLKEGLGALLLVGKKSNILALGGSIEWDLKGISSHTTLYHVDQG